MKAIRRTACAALAALALAGCAGSRAGGDGGGAVVRITVENDGAIPTQVRIYLIPSGGGQEVIVGSMSTLGTETLTARLPVVSGTYRLRAEGGTGYSLTSPGVMLRGSESIIWNMRRNVVRLGSR